MSKPKVLTLDDEINEMIENIDTSQEDKLPPELDTVDHLEEEEEEAAEEDAEAAESETSEGEGEEETSEEGESEEGAESEETEEAESSESSEEESSETSSETDSSDEIEAYKQQIADLQKALNESAAVAPVKTPGEQDSTSEEDDKKTQQFVQVDDIDSVFKDAGSYNEHILQMQDRVFQAAVAAVVPMIGIHIQQAISLNEANKQFYRNNSDLVDFKELVAQNINRIASADPKATLQDVLTKAAEATRTLLKLPTPGGPTPDNSSTEPASSQRAALPSRGTRPGTIKRPQPSELQSEIDDLIKL